MKCLRFGEVYPVPGYATLRCWFQVINTDDECRTARGPQEVGGGRYLNAWMGCADSRKEPDGFFFFFFSDLVSGWMPRKQTRCLDQYGSIYKVG